MLLASLVGMFCSSAMADGVNFEEFSTGSCFISGDTADSGGMFFNTGAPPVGGEGYPNQLFICGGQVVSGDTTLSLIDANGVSDVLMRRNTGITFNLLSFDSGTRTADYDPDSPNDLHNALGVIVIGVFADGSGQISQTFYYDGLAFATFTPTGFDRLSWVEFIAFGDSALPENTLDNIDYTDNLDTPEPGGLLLLGSGFLGVVGTLRRRFA